ncbi:hypothetical protein HYH02_011401 [Chlamydomonas schloesseri]|uniref:Uncharacterized protein n=1 Tax=Chlamydomonas schloesseri TaxID=2026947 RepID=A0A835T4C5_9CHLO|nr:hypothetical protein HYH02_011401 [Chlamydomonas schloesseri]|eukprot:KAG2437146.1 hypothetical protein HYH02_011401 [Chlamydomonas schloesseri]
MDRPNRENLDDALSVSGSAGQGVQAAMEAYKGRLFAYITTVTMAVNQRQSITPPLTVMQRVARRFPRLRGGEPAQRQVVLPEAAASSGALSSAAASSSRGSGRADARAIGIVSTDIPGASHQQHGKRIAATGQQQRHRRRQR